ncbi:MAG: hypothetical protein WA160_12655 [Pseudobdellovibrio sp.]
MKMLLLITLVLGISACDKTKQLDRVLDATETIPVKMDTLAANTDELKRLTIVGEMKKELEDTKNYKVLSPVPYDLNAAAKKAAENFVIDEVVPWVYNLLAKINDAGFEDNYRKTNDVNDPQAVEFEDNKLGTMNAISAVCGFLPEAMINQMIARIRTSEEYTPTMLSMLAMRAQFINGVLMSGKYASPKLTEIGTVEQAIFYNKQVEKLLRLNFATLIKVEVTGFVLRPELNVGLTYGLDQNSAKLNWKAISYGLNHFLKVNQFAVDPSLATDQNNRQAAALADITAGLESWGVTQKAP